MTDPIAFNHLAVFVATLATFMLGGAWYAPGVFGRAWMRECGFTEEWLRQRGGMARIFAVSFVLEYAMAYNLAAFIGAKASFGFAVFAGAAAGIGWVALAFGVTYLFERKPLKLFLINAGYHAVAFTLMGAILGIWR